MKQETGKGGGFALLIWGVLVLAGVAEPLPLR